MWKLKYNVKKAIAHKKLKKRYMKKEEATLETSPSQLYTTNEKARIVQLNNYSYNLVVWSLLMWHACDNQEYRLIN